MKITKKIIYLWLLLFLPYFGFKVYNLYKTNIKYENKYSSAINLYVGSKFPLNGFLDRNGVDVKLDVSKSDITVLDFWFSECPPCLEDMNHFSKLIKGRDKEINVISVSINRYDLWRELFHSSNKRFSVLSHQVPNWKHLVLKSSEDPRLNNAIPIDNVHLLENTFQSTNMPMYFVLDKYGIIKATPYSLSKYIELEVLKRNPFLYFLTDKTTWTTDYFFVPSAIVEYSGFFWIATILLLSIFRLQSKNNS